MSESCGIQVVVRGGGDLASGVILRLVRIGLRVWVTELAQPLAVRRRVSFAQAVYDRSVEVEGVPARRVDRIEDGLELLDQGILPVLVDPDCTVLKHVRPLVLVDARMTKLSPELVYPAEWFTVGLGPGFVVGQNCDAAVETKRGQFLGRVYWSGSPEADTGQPEAVANHGSERVLRAPQSGILRALVAIGDLVPEGAPLVSVGEAVVRARFRGVVRGLLSDGLSVTQGMKIGDLDPRCDPALCGLVSDKALAIGGGVLEAILTIRRLREQLWSTPSR